MGADGACHLRVPGDGRGDVGIDHRAAGDVCPAVVVAAAGESPADVQIPVYAERFPTTRVVHLQDWSAAGLHNCPGHQAQRVGHGHDLLPWRRFSVGAHFDPQPQRLAVKQSLIQRGDAVAQHGAEQPTLHRYVLRLRPQRRAAAVNVVQPEGHGVIAIGHGFAGGGIAQPPLVLEQRGQHCLGSNAALLLRQRPAPAIADGTHQQSRQHHDQNSHCLPVHLYPPLFLQQSTKLATLELPGRMLKTKHPPHPDSGQALCYHDVYCHGGATTALESVPGVRHLCPEHHYTTFFRS